MFFKKIYKIDHPFGCSIINQHLLLILPPNYTLIPKFLLHRSLKLTDDS